MRNFDGTHLLDLVIDADERIVRVYRWENRQCRDIHRDGEIEMFRRERITRQARME